MFYALRQRHANGQTSALHVIFEKWKCQLRDADIDICFGHCMQMLKSCDKLQVPCFFVSDIPIALSIARVHRWLTGTFFVSAKQRAFYYTTSMHDNFNSKQVYNNLNSFLAAVFSDNPHPQHVA